MNVKGTVVSILPVQSGEGKNGTWTKSGYIIETPGQYPKKVAVHVWGSTFPVLKVGQEVDCSVDVESREYNGKWFTEVKAFKIDFIGSATSARVTSSENPKSNKKQENPDEVNDLPF